METKFILDASGNKVREVVITEEALTERVTHNLTPILEYCKLRREQGSSRKAHYREAAVIPDDVVERAFREGWILDNDRWARWFNDPQNKVFHTDDAIKRISGRERR